MPWIRGGKLQYSEKSLENALNGSLKRLQTDYIDLYQLHWPERKTNFFGRLGYKHVENDAEWNEFENILKVLKKFIDQGKIRHIGISNETPWGLSKFLKLSENLRLPRVMAIQNPYNLVNRTFEIGLSEISIREKVGLLAYSPLGVGFLTGKYRENKMPKNSRIALFAENYPRYLSPKTYEAVDEYFEISKKHGISLTHMSLAFVNSRNFLTSNIIGATSMEQLKENIDSLKVTLDKKIIDEIEIVHKNNPNPAP